MKTLAAAAVTLALLAAAAPARAGDAPPDLSARPAPAAELDLALAGAGGGAATPARTVFGLPRNVGPVDRVFRVAVAAALVGIGSYRLSNDSPNRGLSWALVGASAVPAATAATGYCPLYQLLGIDDTF